MLLTYVILTLSRLYCTDSMYIHMYICKYCIWYFMYHSMVWVNKLKMNFDPGIALRSPGNPALRSWLGGNYPSITLAVYPSTIQSRKPSGSGDRKWWKQFQWKHSVMDIDWTYSRTHIHLTDLPIWNIRILYEIYQAKSLYKNYSRISLA